MKKLKLFLALILASMFTSLSYAQITGSAHDFSGLSWNTTGEICIVCHIPHGAITGLTDAPLWNHKISVAVYTLYSSSTMNAVVGQPDGSSKLCLSCHDGTVALENFSGNVGGTHYTTGSFNLGTNLSNDHPISFTYDAALATADGGLYNPVTQNSGLGGTISHDLLIGNKMQCSSCHNVHGSAYSSLLVKDNTGSALCLTCHNK